MVISKFPLIRFSRFFCCFSNSSLNISFISVFNRASEIVTSTILIVRISNENKMSEKKMSENNMVENKISEKQRDSSIDSKNEWLFFSVTYGKT